jgi:hypothetical protein
MPSKKESAILSKSMATTCKACNAPIVFATSEDTGKTIPLDVSNYPVYVLVIHEGKARAGRTPGYVSHVCDVK